MSITKELVIKLVEEIGDDGHTIWDPAVLEGWPVEFQQKHTRTFESDGTGKGTIFTDKGPVESLEGVYGLSVLQDVCNRLGLEYHGYTGRGWAAREYTRVLREWAGLPEVKE